MQSKLQPRKQRRAGSTFENNMKFEGEDGKFYGWAKKDGKDILVEWGSVASEVIKQVGDAAADAIPETPTPPSVEVAVENGEVKVENGVDQSTADLMNRLRSGNVHPDAADPTKPAGTPVDPATPGISTEDQLAALRAGNVGGMTAEQRGASTAGDFVPTPDPVQPEKVTFDFETVTGGLNEIAAILQTIADSVVGPTPEAIGPASLEPESPDVGDIGPSNLDMAMGATKAITNPAGFLVDLLGGALSGGETGGEPIVPASPQVPQAPVALPTLEETGVGQVIANTEAALEPINSTNLSLTELKTPIIELPMKMDESMMRQTMELSTVIGTYLTQLCAKADEIVAAMTRDSESVKVEPGISPLAVRMDGLAGMLAAKTGGAKYLGNVGTAAGGMNLGAGNTQQR